MKKLLSFLIGLSLTSFILPSHAESLLQVYQQAKASNPDLRSSLATRDSAFEKINQSRGSLLPQLGLSGNASTDKGYRDNSGARSDNYSGSLQLTQVLFDLSKWRALSLTEKQAGIQDVSYQIAEQKLILNTATAYFKVLSAIDTLTFTEASKREIYRQLDQVTQKFNVGLTSITDVQNARAQYDQVVADEVSARNALNNALEALRQISGVYYPQLNTLNVERFKTESQTNVQTLLKDAEKYNLTLLNARLQQDIAREQIKLAQTGHMPTVNLEASTSLKKNRDYGNNVLFNSSDPTSTTGQSTLGVNLQVPLYSGGTVNSQVKQAQYGFVSASEDLESVHREVINNVNSSYNNTTAAISSISALQQAVVSAQSSLDATQAGYQVGTRTIIDVLIATTGLYNAKQKLSSTRYDYLISLLNVKSALGTLNQEDLIKLNNTLGVPISTQGLVISPERR